MEIKIATSVGLGKTKLSAFDNALQNMGVCNYNLIYLSSIIPPDCVVNTISKYSTPKSDFGKRLYVVCSEARSDMKDACIGSVVGWYQLPGGAGYFVEHHIESGDGFVGRESLDKVELKLKADVIASLEDMCKFRNVRFDSKNVRYSMSAACVDNDPIATVTLAIYKAENW